MPASVPESVPWAFYRDTHPYAVRNVELARQELAAGGRPDGARFTLRLANASPPLSALAALMKAQVADVGLEMDLQEVPFEAALANAAAGSYQALNLNWGGEPDPRAHVESVL